MASTSCRCPIVARNYKTDKAHGVYVMPLPNRRFDDGTCLYDYLDQYTCGYWVAGSFAKSGIYDWWDPDCLGKRGKWVTKGMMEFKPETTLHEPHRSTQAAPWRWTWVFPAPRTGKQAKLSGFARSYSQASFQYLGKRINLHLYRTLWAAWAGQKELSDSEKRSLAYAMGMTVETMTKIYERCTPEEKARPIFEAIDRKLFQEMGEPENQEKPAKKPLSPLAQMKQMMQKLSPEERQQLLDDWNGDDQVG